MGGCGDRRTRTLDWGPECSLEGRPRPTYSIYSTKNQNRFLRRVLFFGRDGGGVRFSARSRPRRLHAGPRAELATDLVLGAGDVAARPFPLRTTRARAPCDARSRSLGTERSRGRAEPGPGSLGFAAFWRMLRGWFCAIGRPLIQPTAPATHQPAPAASTRRGPAVCVGKTWTGARSRRVERW